MNGSPSESAWQEGAGGLLLLAAANETGFLSQVEEVLSKQQQPSDVHQPERQSLWTPQQSLLLTLFFLPAVGLHRFWDLRSSTGQELALLTGRTRPYSYRHTERFLLHLVSLQADQALTEALARWTASVWQIEKKSQEVSFYVDGHRKPVYTNTLIPRGLIGRLGKIAGCRALALLHDERGHPLLLTTSRGDLHLTQSFSPLLTAYEQVHETLHLKHLVVDREAMAADFLALIHNEGRVMTTILKTKQYHGLDDFQSARSICATHGR